MDCPECGGQLTDYHLGDRGAVGCDDCGYVGIDAEHRGRPSEQESWDDALERFHRRHGGARRASDDAAGTAGERADADEPSDDARAADERGGTTHDDEDRSADDPETGRSAVVNGVLGNGSVEEADEA